MLRVGDLDAAIAFYTQVLGMKLLRTRDNPEYKYTLAFLGGWVGGWVGGWPHFCILCKSATGRMLHLSGAGLVFVVFLWTGVFHHLGWVPHLATHLPAAAPPRASLPLPAGYGPEESSTVFELTYNYGKESYEKGNAYAQVAISTKVSEQCAVIKLLSY